ncbi:hypothetical protein V6K52_12065 [Knoellia sp. S7-12]|uniref:hypothetical protein n=1 Tax=Knoellia sp. S7-12 TaxID=3126698 RepID=UPI0033678A89
MKGLVCAGLVALVSACGSAAGSPPASTPSVSTPSHTAANTPAAEFSCGEVVLKQGEEPAEAGAKELACLGRALKEGRRATLDVTAPSVEGHLSVSHWQLSSDGTLSADIDSSRDPFSSEDHTHQSCGRITELPDPLSCAPRG